MSINELCVCGHDKPSHDFDDDRGACAWGIDVGQEDDCMSWRPVSTCQHRNTTFSRDICPDPCHTMHTFCDDCGGMLEDCWNDAGRGVCAKPNNEGLNCLKDEGHDGPCWATRGRMQTTWIPLTTASPVERAAANELTRELDTVYAEPTGADRRLGREMLAEAEKYAGVVVPEHVHEWIVRTVADVLAAERAAIHARYEAVAVKCEREARSRSHYAKVDPEYRSSVIPYEVSAEWIRQVAAQ